ncbi:unnamed protein product [Ambrosiozyma monospora]|uniref:Unnamed protein product n=1 Tax=Ambrosiozyma monospora TaxID=43982 RepID=A0A9W6YXQ2_AMBMO|nr:unnamed protein product [Ambrosiozyma monospora]
MEVLVRDGKHLSNDSIPAQNSLRDLELTRQASELNNQEMIDNAITFEEWENYEDMESFTVWKLTCSTSID